MRRITATSAALALLLGLASAAQSQTTRFDEANADPNWVAADWQWQDCFDIALSGIPARSSNEACNQCVDHYRQGNVPSRQVAACQQHANCPQAAALANCLLTQQACSMGQTRYTPSGVAYLCTVTPAIRGVNKQLP